MKLDCVNCTNSKCECHKSAPTNSTTLTVNDLSATLFAPVLANVWPADYPTQILRIVAKLERERLLKALKADGSTGDSLEMSWVEVETIFGV